MISGWDSHPHLGQIYVNAYWHEKDCKVAPGQLGADPILTPRFLGRVQKFFTRKGPREEIW